MSATHDFDFLHGSWVVRHRKLRRRLAGDTSWDEFGGTMRCRPILSGLGNVDDNVIHLPDGSYEACTLRLYNPASGCWSIHWVDGRDPKLDPPLTGGFADSTGTFLGEDVFEGRPILIRFLWTPGLAAARWEQAFSDDGGASWETNWSMAFSRADEEASA